MFCCTDPADPIFLANQNNNTDFCYKSFYSIYFFLIGSSFIIRNDPAGKLSYCTVFILSWKTRQTVSLPWWSVFLFSDVLTLKLRIGPTDQLINSPCNKKLSCVCFNYNDSNHEKSMCNITSDYSTLYIHQKYNYRCNTKFINDTEIQ